MFAGSRGTLHVHLDDADLLAEEWRGRLRLLTQAS
jgi:hypothetical protein